MLEVHNVWKRFRKGGKEIVALKAVSFSAERGCLVILGLNGAGKTTLLNIITGLLIPDEGYVRVDGTDPVKDPGNVAIPFIPWEDARMTVRDAVYAMEMFNDVNIPEKLIRLLKLEEHMDAQIQKLSTGVYRRVQLLNALSSPHRVVLLDEVTNGLDLEAFEVFKNTIKAIKGKKLILFATHIFEHAEAVADNVLILHEGIVKKYAKLKDVLKLAGEVLRVRGTNIGMGTYVDGEWVIPVEDAEKELPRIVKTIIERGGEIESIRVESGSLKDAFARVIQ